MYVEVLENVYKIKSQLSGSYIVVDSVMSQTGATLGTGVDVVTGVDPAYTQFCLEVPVSPEHP